MIGPSIYSKSKEKESKGEMDHLYTARAKRIGSSNKSTGKMGASKAKARARRVKARAEARASVNKE